MKVLGALLLIFGLIGLLLDLIYWLPAKFSPIVAALIGAVCLAAVWGGGKMSTSNVRPLASDTRATVRAQTQRAPAAVSTVCPRCSSQVMPGQQFCGTCGSSLISHCARCGNTIAEPSRFCGRCGARLS